MGAARTREQAEALVREELASHGFAWEDPVLVRRGWTTWQFHMRSDRRGGPFVRVRIRDGRVRTRYYSR